MIDMQLWMDLQMAAYTHFSLFVALNFHFSFQAICQTYADIGEGVRRVKNLVGYCDC